MYGQGVKWFLITSGGCFIAGVFHYMKIEKKSAATSVITSKYIPWDSNWDKRDISSVLKPHKYKSGSKKASKMEEKKLSLTSTAKRHIFLIRHGDYDNSSDKDTERKLTPLGLEQSALVGQHLRHLKWNYTKLIRSTMTRAMQTSEEIIKFFPDIQIESSDLLREGEPIPSEPPMGRWREEYKYHVDGARIEAAFRHYFHRAVPEQKKDSYEIIVCHANVIRYFICRLLQVPPEAWLRFSLHHCSITKATIEPNGNVSVSAIGDFGFIPAKKFTRK